ncbi:hypothetical protein MUK42_09474 [Musa troglodytarum]|uniref:Uncharacterized protein n=1 Tax=Musa troglodytarum TaxID=320322 RepID=A0A9E7EAC3_9LILI|nr:hypothetical protein MUK42_09474 [Musa troglodytarum]
MVSNWLSKQQQQPWWVFVLWDHGQEPPAWMLGLWVQREGPEGVTGPCGSDSSRRPPWSCHQSPSMGLAAIRGCKLDTSSRNNSSSLVAMAAMIDACYACDRGCKNERCDVKCEAKVWGEGSSIYSAAT